MRSSERRQFGDELVHPTLLPDGVPDDDAFRHHSSLEVETIGFQEFPPQVDSIAQVRRFVRRTLESAGVSNEHIFDCQLIADELATNAVRYAGSMFSVAVELTDSFIRVCVRDDSDSLPVERDVSAEALGGRGLTLVSGTSSSWGIVSLGLGKETWADVWDDGLRAVAPVGVPSEVGGVGEVESMLLTIQERNLS
jgi:anti-sigma regulatory factor (Ser/Thr protein kinase)